MFDPTNYNAVDPQLLESLTEYALHGRPTGGFLRSVLENNLMDAACSADAQNKLVLQDLCKFMYNELPEGCWGSTDAVCAWIDGDGLRGIDLQAYRCEMDDLNRRNGDGA